MEYSNENDRERKRSSSDLRNSMPVHLIAPEEPALITTLDDSRWLNVYPHPDTGESILDGLGPMDDADLLLTNSLRDALEREAKAIESNALLEAETRRSAERSTCRRRQSGQP